MIKSLQKKFIFSAMLAVTLLLVVLISSLNIANGFIQTKQNNMQLDSIINEEFTKKSPDGIHDKPFGLFGTPIDNGRSRLFFTVSIGEDGEIHRVDVSRIPDITNEDALEIYSDVGSSLSGKTDGFIYKIVLDSRNGDTVYVFLNTEMQSRAVWNVFLLSILVGAACWAATLLLVILLSKKAIKPIAENVERQKKFVTDAGHEIKTPLAIIRSNTEAMELYNGENKWTRNIKKQVDRLDGLTQNLLILAKSDEEEMNASMENASVTELTVNSVKMFEEAASAKGLELEEDIQPDVTAKVNSRLYSSLVSILTDNAVKYSSENSTVSVRLRKKDRHISFEISNICDALPGCPEQQLFDRFYRPDASRNQKNGGYGIGLSAAKSIAEAHGGSIEAVYEVGNRITFKVKI